MTIADWLGLLLPLLFACVLLWKRHKRQQSLAQAFGTTFDRQVPLEVTVGIAIGGIVMLGVFTVEWTLGAVQFTGSNGMTELWWRWLLLLVVAALFEELLARSFLLGGLLSLLGKAKWTAVVISALYFGIAHITNPNATIVSAGGNALGGVMYAVAFLGSGRIWMACGLHFAWNFFQGMVFGFPVSGITTPSILHQTAVGPEWATGGAYGPEAGLVGMLSRLVVIVLVFGWLKRRQPEKSWGKLLRFE